MESALGRSSHLSTTTGAHEPMRSMSRPVRLDDHQIPVVRAEKPLLGSARELSEQRVEEPLR